MNGSSLMKHLVAAILLLYSASPSATAPRPQAQRFRFQFTESWNRHHIFGADGRRAKSTVELSLERSGAASLRDEGYRGSSTLSRRWGYKSDRRDWSLSWTGRWRLEKGKLLVVLRRTNLRCSETRRRQGAAKRRAPCKPSPTTLRLRCDRSPLRVLLAPMPKSLALTAWRCLPESGPVPPVGTSLPWYFSSARCIRVVSGGRGLGYTLCP